MAIIRRNVELEARLIDDLLDLTRIARGKLLLNRRAVDVRKVLQHALETCQAEVVEKKVHLQIDMPEEALMVDGDAARLQQVFWNVLKNAIKFTPDHGVIALHATGSQGLVRVEIKDTGKGIEAEVLPRVFEAFEQGDTGVTRRYGGLGLGLAICKGLVTMHDGSIRAASEGPGKGSTFVVELPMLESGVAGDAATVAVGSPGAALVNRGQSILLVEDHESTAVMTARLLRSFGYRVTTVGCAKAALQAFAGGSFDLVISDLGLPDGSGQDLLREMLVRRAVRAIALSGYGMDSDVQESLRAGFREHLVKPINVQQLKDAIERVIGKE